MEATAMTGGVFMKMKKADGLLLFFGIVLCTVILLAVVLPGVHKETKPAQTESTQIMLQQDGVVISGTGVFVEENIVTIERGGNYQITGTLTDGQIYVEAGKAEEVILSLNGVDISNASDAAIYIEEAQHTTILLMEQSVNRLQSGIASADAGGQGEKESSKESGAALYAKDDLTVTGTGTLKVMGYHNNGIHTKKNLLLENGTVEVEALNHGMKGAESVTVTGGDIKITAGNKGIQSVYELMVQGGRIEIADSTEGMEANQVTIEDGIISIMAADDGINANGGAAKKEKKGSEDIVEDMPNLRIRGGEVYVNADGDGLDSNGNLLIEGGIVIIDGPTKNDDGPLDYGSENDGYCRIQGGIVLAIGSAGMAETFDEKSSQCSFRHIFKIPYAAGSEISVTDSSGTVLYCHTAAKEGASVVFSAPKLTVGETYLLTAGGEKVEITLDTISTVSGEPLK